MQLRPYQHEAVLAVHAGLHNRPDNPAVSLPTGSGKTVIFASLLQQWHVSYPPTRSLVLAHRQELLTQAEDKLLAVWPTAPVGVYSAGVGRKEPTSSIVIAGIQSAFRDPAIFGHRDVVIVDEAHRIPDSEESMYQQTLAGLREINPAIRVVGFTATPYRMDGGLIYGDGRPFGYLAYEANIADLIASGYLCRLTAKGADNQSDVSGVSVQRGEFVQKQLEEVVMAAGAVESSVRELIVRAKERQAWLIFCAGVAHAEAVSEALARHHIEAPVVTGETFQAVREQTLGDFQAGRIRAICNCNVLTEGFDATRIDCIALMRPTASPSLYVQMVGRGFRLHPGKESCLVIDFGGNIERHGPVDLVSPSRGRSGNGNGVAPTKKCPACSEMVHASVRVCCECGYQWPVEEKRLAPPSEFSPLSTEVSEATVNGSMVARHKKEDRPDSMRVDYTSGISTTYREWICFEHTGYARTKAEEWWRRRFTNPVPNTVSEALDLLDWGDDLRTITKRLRVQKKEKYWQIVGYELGDRITLADALPPKADDEIPF